MLWMIVQLVCCRFVIKPRDLPRYYTDYRKLYLHTIQRAVEAEDRSRPFVSSSPSNGVETEQEGGVAKYPQDRRYGDVHYYNYTCDGWNYNCFPIPRFASEYGFQSWCSIETLAVVSQAEDWRMNSSFCEHRQHHPNGNAELVAQVSQHLNLSKSSNASERFIHFIYLTQVNQAVSIKTESEHYRRMQSSVTREGLGLTMGSLYWQLNDIWQAPTWASIEYGGRWKMLHYYARRFYEPTLLSPVVTADQTLLVYLINDSLPAFESKPISSQQSAWLNNTLLFEPHVQDSKRMFAHPWQSRDYREPIQKQSMEECPLMLVIEVYLWERLKLVKVWRIPVTQTPTVASTVIHSSQLSSLLSASHCPSRDHCMLHFLLYSHTTQLPHASNWLLLSNFTTAQGLRKAHVEVTAVTVRSSTQLSLKLKTDTIAPFVWLQLPGYQGYFEDNGFIMLQEQLVLTYTCFVNFTNNVTVTPKSFKVMSLMDIYD